jgi:membrane associated rhomboid family serine protease
MIPISDENPTMRFPLVTVLLLVALGLVWIFVQGAGFDPLTLARTVCDYGLVPGELTHQAHLGDRVQVGPQLYCVVDNDPINWFTPLTSMFLHGGWMHLLGNGLFLWVFGNNVEDSMGRLRFLLFYVLCGLAAAAAQVFVGPSSAVPMVGASGAIAGVLGAYLILYPRVRVRVLFILVIFVFTVRVPAWTVLIWWIGYQIIAALPQLSPVSSQVSSGVAVWAHIGGFFAGVGLVKIFENRDRVYERTHSGPRVTRLPW